MAISCEKCRKRFPSRAYVAINGICRSCYEAMPAAERPPLQRQQMNADAKPREIGGHRLLCAVCDGDEHAGRDVARPRLGQPPSPQLRLRPLRLRDVVPALTGCARWPTDARCYAAAVKPADAIRLAQRMQPIVARYPQVAAAWLFGSAARGELRPDSDIDVGLLLRDPAATAVDEYMMLGDVAAHLEVVTAPRTVDVVLLEHQGPVLAHEALIDGVLILEADPERRATFEATTVVRAIDFQPTLELARAGQLEGFRRRLRELR